MTFIGVTLFFNSVIITKMAKDCGETKYFWAGVGLAVASVLTVVLV